MKSKKEKFVMEIFDSKKKYILHTFQPEFSEEELRVDMEVIPANGVEFYLNPAMGVDEKNNMYVIGLEFGFMKDQKPCSNSVYSKIQFYNDSEERVFVKEDKGLKLINYQLLCQMVDTSVGILRGVLITKCVNTPASQFVLPFIDVNLLIRQLQIKFLD